MKAIYRKQDEKRKTVLGMPAGTANARLLKLIIFEFSIRLEMDVCYRCGGKILQQSDMSIEHKTAWLNHPDPICMFFAIENIAFSHKKCNYAAANHPHAKNRTHEEMKEVWRNNKQKNYTKEKRQKKYREKGY